MSAARGSPRPPILLINYLQTWGIPITSLRIDNVRMTPKTQEDSMSHRLVDMSCRTPCDLMNCSTPGFQVFHYLSWSLKLMFIDSVMPSNHLILCRPLLLLLSIFPSIRVFSNELALLIRLPKYWSFSFSISPSNEYSGLISFRTDWFDLLAVQGTLKSLL